MKRMKGRDVYRDLGSFLIVLAALALGIMSVKSLLQICGILAAAFPLIVSWIALFFCYKVFIKD